MLLSLGFSALSPPACVPTLLRAARSSREGSLQWIWCRHLRHKRRHCLGSVCSRAQPWGASSCLPRAARTRSPRCQARAREAGSMPGLRSQPPSRKHGRDKREASATSHRPHRGIPRGRVRAAPHPERGSPAGAPGQESPLVFTGRQPLLAATPAEIFPGVAGRTAVASLGSGSLNGLPLAPAARSGSQQHHYSDRHTERRRHHGAGTQDR